MTKRLGINLVDSIAALFGAAMLLLGLSAGAAAADAKRVALIVGNSAYESVPQLPNPSRDAGAVAKLFRDAGFDVTLISNVGNLDFKRAIRKFEAASDQAEMAVIYYAGHGIEISGTNYLIPIDAKLASDRDADDEAIALERLVSSADGASKLRVVILDACRDNPFTVRMRRERKLASRAVTSGLGKIEPTSADTLIAYAAKAGSTAEDGQGDHSPFTNAILKNLTVPGLDIRLAFGRIRDEVLKTTGNRQEPFVYGSLGGGNISLVPPPAVAQETSTNDVKADYDLVAKIGSRRAWEVFLNTYKTGFYADLARAQIASLSDQVPKSEPPSGTANVKTAAVPPETIAPGREPSSKESLDWDRVKDSTDIAALEKFIKRYPDSPLSLNARSRIDLLQQIAREREERIRAEELAKLQAAQKKAEEAAARKREEDERRARKAEADARAKADEAERKATEARLKAIEADRNKAAAEAAALREESERQARQAEEERRKATAAAISETICQDEQAKFEELKAKGSEGSGFDDIKSFAKTVTCARVKPLLAATVERFKLEAEERAAKTANSPKLVRSAQVELARIGCLRGEPDGVLSKTTKAALGRYFGVKGNNKSSDVEVTEALVSDLAKETGRVCPLECKSGEIAKGETCIASKPAEPKAASRRNRDDDEDDRASARRKPQRREATQERRESRPEPRARQQAYTRPGGGGGGGGAMIGVGF